MERDGLLYDVTYRRIRSDIMDLTLEPGTALSVRKLAERYQVSRTPAREAVLRLQKEDLVETFPQSRTIVSKISAGRVEEERFIRKALEMASFQDFIARESPAVLDALEYLIRKQKEHLEFGRDRDFFESDQKFHRMIFETAGKGLAWKIANTALTHYNRFRFLTVRIRILDERIIREHSRMVEAAREGDEEKMRRIFSDHADSCRGELKKLESVYPRYFAGKA